MSARGRGGALVAVAIVASLALVLSYLAAGGASYEPVKVQDPCEPRPWRHPEGLEQLAEQFSLSALDGAACRLGVSRETLARALATPASRERFAKRYGLSEAEIARAVRAGLLRAVDDAERAGALNPLLAAPLRAALRRIPIDQAIELIQNAESLLDSLQSFLGPAGGLIEQFLP
ncbi:MAG TPA: hypothetical protein VFG58_02450 [Solirubrobacterales bacterium]|nr:hypothetical protein [Solirubrobacterales bacterium]